MIDVIYEENKLFGRNLCLIDCSLTSLYILPNLPYPSLLKGGNKKRKNYEQRN
ncbi:hypothetical protein MHA_2577 [Mannheimia haemolytica PHL213]|nr:hypothetical protein MHA_2577 [Mannheimia haemolytica PHL213]EEY11743.1 hypothetical protein COK_2177 [Mannheimia haemolytica serotype A2 str. BOVINE]